MAWWMREEIWDGEAIRDREEGRYRRRGRVSRISVGKEGQEGDGVGWKGQKMEKSREGMIASREGVGPEDGSFSV